LKSALLISFLIFMCCILFSCNAPHLNPLDPFSEGQNYATIKGVIESYGQPATKIADVSVYWEPQKILVKSDTSGNFIMSNIFPNNGKLILSKEGYLSDTLSISLDKNRMFSDTVKLKKIPQVEYMQFYSVNVLSLDSTAFTELYMQIKISDPDKSIDSVFIRNANLNFSEGLTLNANGNYYEVEIKKDDLGVGNLEQVVGYDFDVFAVDSVYETYLIGTGRVARIITNYPKLSTPTNNDTLTSTSTQSLTWQNYSADFQFTYSVVIYNDVFPGFSTDADYLYSSPEISQDTTEMSIPKTLTLTSGDYYWAVWVIDSFGDRICSLPYKFHVK
jgi:hypothetical protein